MGRIILSLGQHLYPHAPRLRVAWEKTVILRPAETALGHSPRDLGALSRSTWLTRVLAWCNEMLMQIAVGKALYHPAYQDHGLSEVGVPWRAPCHTQRLHFGESP